MNLKKIKCVIVDFDGTLYSDGDWSGEDEHFNKFFNSNEYFKTHKITTKELYELYPNFHIFQAVYAYIYDHMLDDGEFRKFDNENIWNILCDEIRFIEPNVLKEVSKFYELYMVSDSSRPYLEHYMEYAKIDKSVFKEYLSNQYIDDDMSKVPMMKRVINLTGLKPNEILMIGDSQQCDMEPAKKLGIQTCFVKDVSETEEILNRLIDLKRHF